MIHPIFMDENKKLVDSKNFVHELKLADMKVLIMIMRLSLKNDRKSQDFNMASVEDAARKSEVGLVMSNAQMIHYFQKNYSLLEWI